MRLIDSHCHLYAGLLERDAAGALERARAAEVLDVIVPAYDHASWELVAGQARDLGVVAMFGLHPWVADEPLDEVRLEALLRGHRPVGVGEIGLDYQVERPEPAVQRAVLERQLVLAGRLDLPVALHCRGAFEDLLAILAACRPRVRGVVHAFSRGPELAERFLNAGLLIGLGGAITRPRARARRSAQVVPLDRILLETDAPSIGLEGIEAERVEPRHTREVAIALAELRGVELEEVARATTDNARRLFDIP